MKKKHSALRLMITSLWSASLAGALMPNPALPQAPYYEGKTIKAIVGQAERLERFEVRLPAIRRSFPFRPRIAYQSQLLIACGTLR
jgi:hypothetical protein